MAPTTAQVTTIRARTGDNRQPYMLQPGRITALFAEADSDVNRTVVLALREIIIGLSTGSIDYPPECGDKDEYLNRLRSALDDFEKQAGIYGGPLRTGVINLRIDAEEDNLG